MDTTDPRMDKGQCATYKTQMFVQTACVIPQDMERDRRVLGLAYSCLIIFISLAILNYVDYIRQIQKNDYLEWDVKTITAGDYTVEFVLDA